MIELLMLFIEWVKSILAKETLFTFISIPLATFLAWITHKAFKNELEVLAVDNVRYWLYLIVSFLLIIYGIRLVESVFKKVLIKKEKKE